MLFGALSTALSDGQHCIKEPQLDVTNGKGFLEAALYHHKTAQKRRTKVVRLLSVAGVLPGVSGCDWATHWLKKRAEMGLRASMQEPTMPAPMSGGGWTRQPLSSSEASMWMRELLQSWSPENLKDIATHSSKATVLSWMSKSNVDISLRRLAGYHIALVTRAPWNIQGMLLLQCSDRSKPFHCSESQLVPT